MEHAALKGCVEQVCAILKGVELDTRQGLFAEPVPYEMQGSGLAVSNRAGGGAAQRGRTLDGGV